MAESESKSDFFTNWTKETLEINGVPAEFPVRFFKFASCDSKYFQYSALELFIHNRLRLASPREFNDPFDCSLTLNPVAAEEAELFLQGVYRDHGAGITRQEIAERTKDLSRFGEDTEATLRAIFAQSGICSFSSSVRHPLMWAHYAASHRGVAYVFSHKADERFVPMPVRYQDQITTYSLSDRDGIALAALVKGIDWKYEKEWRIVEARNGGAWKDVGSDILSGVVFGARCAEQDKEFLLELIKRRVDVGLPPLRVYLAQINQRKFELEFFQVASGGWKQVELP